MLYTTQLTQKAKKYHDGTLRLSQLGSHGKQVKILLAIFLKNVSLNCGGLYSFFHSMMQNAYWYSVEIQREDKLTK